MRHADHVHQPRDDRPARPSGIIRARIRPEPATDPGTGKLLPERVRRMRKPGLGVPVHRPPLFRNPLPTPLHSMSLNEFIVEDAALEWFGELGYAVGHGPHLAPGEPAAERASFAEVVLAGRLREAIGRLNPAMPEEAHEEALRKVQRVDTPALTRTNRAFHRMLRDGVPVEYPRPDGCIAGDHVRLLDFGDERATHGALSLIHGNMTPLVAR